MQKLKTISKQLNNAPYLNFFCSYRLKLLASIELYIMFTEDNTKWLLLQCHYACKNIIMHINSFCHRKTCGWCFYFEGQIKIQIPFCMWQVQWWVKRRLRCKYLWNYCSPRMMLVISFGGFSYIVKWSHRKPCDTSISFNDN